MIFTNSHKITVQTQHLKYVQSLSVCDPIIQQNVGLPGCWNTALEPPQKSMKKRLDPKPLMLVGDDGVLLLADGFSIEEVRSLWL